MLWQQLRRRAAGGWRFRRQHVVGGFIVDFYCPELRLAVEVDGDVHRSRDDYDRGRDRILAGLGVATVRVRNDEVLDNAWTVARRLEQACSERAARCSLSPDSGERVGDRGLSAGDASDPSVDDGDGTDVSRRW